jgi:hypothetical protein
LAFLPICHCQAGGIGAQAQSQPDPISRGIRPNSKHRVDVTPAKRGKGSTRHENEDKTPEQGHRRHDLGKAWKAAEAGGFNRKSGVLNHIEVG